MKTQDKTTEVIGPDHKISVVANNLSNNAPRIAAEAQLTEWEFAVALANACGQILAHHKDMPRDRALERFDALCEVMAGAYDLYGVEGKMQ